MTEDVMMRAPIGVKDALKAEAKRMGISVNALMIQIVGEWMKKVNADA